MLALGARNAADNLVTISIFSAVATIDVVPTAVAEIV